MHFLLKSLALIAIISDQFWVKKGKKTWSWYSYFQANGYEDSHFCCIFYDV